VRGKLLENSMNGKDQAVQSLKLLGADREVNMWQPENVSGGFFLNVPNDWKHLFGQAPPPDAPSKSNLRKVRDGLCQGSRNRGGRCPRWREWLSALGATPAERYKLKIG